MVQMWVVSLGTIFIVASLIGIVFRPTRDFFKIFAQPLRIPVMTLLIVMLVAGIGMGGWAAIAEWLPMQTASVGGGDDGGFFGGGRDEVVSSQPILENCDFIAGVGLAGNITVREDTVSNNVVHLDVHQSEFPANNPVGDINVTFTCNRIGSPQFAGAAEILIEGEEFRSEISTSDTNTYNILETSTRTSSFTGKPYTQTIYVGDGASATASDSKERGFLTFAEGEKTATLGILGEIDETNFGRLNNFTEKKVTIYERYNGQQVRLGDIIIQKAVAL